MIRISLPDTDREQLIRLREGSISEHSEKALMVILSDQGKSPLEIAKHLQRNPHTVRDWLKRYQLHGIAGFRREYSPGRTATVRGTIIEIIEEIIEKTPSSYGLHANSWTAQLIVDHLKTLDIHSSIDTVKRALKDLGYSYKRPTKTVPENAPTSTEKKERVLDMIDQIKGIIQQKDCEILALDESHFSTAPYLSRGWIKRGQKKTSIAIHSRKTHPVWCIKSPDNTYVLEKCAHGKQ